MIDSHGGLEHTKDARTLEADAKTSASLTWKSLPVHPLLHVHSWTFVGMPPMESIHRYIRKRAMSSWKVIKPTLRHA